MEVEKVNIALENLNKTAGITGTLNNHGLKQIDGNLELIIDNLPVKFNAEIKQELRAHQFPKIIERVKDFAPLMIVASKHIFVLSSLNYLYGAKNIHT